MMTITIKHSELREFQQIIKDNNVKHGPFRKSRSYQNGGNIGYTIDILESGPTDTYFRLKYADLNN